MEKTGDTYLADTVDHVVENGVHSLNLTLDFVAAEPHADADGLLGFAVLVLLVVELGSLLLDGLVAEVADVDDLGAGLARGEGDGERLCG